MVPRAPHLDPGPHRQLLVDAPRPAPTLGLEQDGHAVAPAIEGIATQGVLPDEVVLEHEVDVGAGLPGREVDAVDGLEDELDDSARALPPTGDHGEERGVSDREVTRIDELGLQGFGNHGHL